MVAAHRMGHAALLLLLCLLGLAAGVPQRSPQGGPSPDAGSARAPGWAFLESYPRQYVVNRLQPGEHITIDGRLDEEAWGAVNWTEPMEDIAQPFYPDLSIPVCLTPPHPTPLAATILSRTTRRAGRRRATRR